MSTCLGSGRGEEGMVLLMGAALKSVRECFLSMHTFCTQSALT